MVYVNNSRKRISSAALVIPMSLMACGYAIAPAQAQDSATPPHFEESVGGGAPEATQPNTGNGGNDTPSSNNPEDMTNVKLTMAYFDITDDEARDILRKLEVKPSQDSVSAEGFAGYNDSDHDGCDTRSDILVRDMENVKLVGGDGCVVEGGSLVSPYSGKETNYNQAEVDHVVSVENALQSGAAEWDQEKKTEFYNSPLVLLTVSKADIGSKNGDSIDKWKPSDKSFVKYYAARQLQIKERFGLSITEEEKAAFEKIIDAPRNPDGVHSGITPQENTGVSDIHADGADRQRAMGRSMEERARGQHEPKEQRIVHDGIGIVNNARGNTDDIRIGIILHPDGKVEFRTGDGSTHHGSISQSNSSSRNGTSTAHSHAGTVSYARSQAHAGAGVAPVLQTGGAQQSSSRSSATASEKGTTATSHSRGDGSKSDARAHGENNRASSLSNGSTRGSQGSRDGITYERGNTGLQARAQAHTAHSTSTQVSESVDKNTTPETQDEQGSLWDKIMKLFRLS